MPKTEVYAKFEIRSGRVPAFQQEVAKLMAAVGRPANGLLRFHWFLAPDKSRSVAALIYENDAAMVAHGKDLEPSVRALRELAEVTSECAGTPSREAVTALACLNPRVYRFHSGLKGAPDPLDAMYARLDPAKAPIDLLTQFEIKPGALPAFKSLSTELVKIVGRDDPGTLRYDWFVDEANLRCVVRDIYKDSPAMFAHMKNCKVVHDELLTHTSLHVNDFMGDLPAETKAVVSKYDCFIHTRV